MDLQLHPDEHAFRAEARAFFAEALPPEVRRAQRLTPTVYAEFEVSQRFHRILAARGWSVPGWPREHGGPGWSLTQRYLWQVESARAGAPITSPMGLSLVGPVVMHFGTPAQQAWVLEGIRSGEHYWCQGFSEPGAGSDLAALKTRAVADGDDDDSDYLVSGSKIWTTHAHCAQWMAALVRTCDTGKRQDGISFLLIDLRSSGVSIRPIRTIGGDHEVNQVFFDEVRVPQRHRVGAEGQGWSIAKFLLEFERGGDFAAPALRMAWADACDTARNPAGVIEDPDLAREIALVGIDIDMLEMLELRAMAAMSAAVSPGAIASMLKLRASQLQQAVAELMVRVLGEAALRWEYRRPLCDIAQIGEDEGEVRTAMPRYLNSRANTIFGGSSEIQRSLIAKMVGAV